MATPDPTNPESTSALSSRKKAPLQKILVAIPFLETSSVSIDYAVQLAKVAGTQIVLLHVIDIPRYDLDTKVLAASERNQANLNAMRQNAIAHLESLCKEIKTSGVDCSASVRIGVPYEEILEEAEKIAPDLIITGSKGRSGLARFLLGSTTERVVRHAPCSVLVARQPSP
jgi:universal stress protein A